MKKNVMMRVASALLVAVLLSTCAISGTFAKYVTEATGSDSARVAKWGVNIATTGSMFAGEEVAGDSATTVAKTVLSTGGNLVAPGMDGTMAEIVVTGAPEVAVKITHEATVAISGWAITGDDFYCPLVITVEGHDIKGLDYDTAALVAEAIKMAIDGHSKEYDAGTDLNTTADEVNVSWKWDVEGTAGGEQTDAKDTLVADVTATIEIGIKTTVTQID